MIYCDEQDLNLLDIEDLRKNIGSCLQTTGVLGGTIYDNLVCGGNYSAHQVKEALERSGFIEDVENLPMGLHTVIVPGGTTLSGGQAQRLQLARALMGSPSILLLDEATSALDNKAQITVTKNIDKLGVSRLVIAQRLSTVKNLDRILVLDQGEIVQMGTFKELINQPGLFQELCKRQTL